MFFFTLCYKTCGFALNNYVTYEESITKFTNFTFVTLNYTLRYVHDKRLVVWVKRITLLMQINLSRLPTF